jgi:hypothetical protein
LKKIPSEEVMPPAYDDRVPKHPVFESALLEQEMAAFRRRYIHGCIL